MPDGVAGAGVKLRCSVCKTVFVYAAPKLAMPELAKNAKEMDKAAVPAKRPSLPFGRTLRFALILALCLAGCAGGYYYWHKLSNAPKPQEQDIAQKVSMLTLRNVRWYYVDNEKNGRIFVIEGKVVNEFPRPKALIAVEAAIYDKDKKPLSVKKQLAGTQLSFFQLQVLSDNEMESFLNNKMEIFSNNNNVPCGGEVPFMALFYSPPAGVAEVDVRIVDVQDVEQPEK